MEREGGRRGGKEREREREREERERRRDGGRQGEREREREREKRGRGGGMEGGREREERERRRDRGRERVKTTLDLSYKVLTRKCCGTAKDPTAVFTSFFSPSNSASGDSVTPSLTITNAKIPAVVMTTVN